MLIIVLWVAFGLVSLAIYFANSSSLELRAADNRVAALEAEQAIAGAARYVSNALANVTEPGTPPDPATFKAEAIRIGNARYWLIGQPLDEEDDDVVTWGLVDEASKLNLNTATAAVLAKLPRMTDALAAAVVDWRDTDSNAGENGAEDDIYGRLNPAYRCKNAPFESMWTSSMMKTLNGQAEGANWHSSRMRLASSRLRLEAASISTTSRQLPCSIARQTGSSTAKSA